MRIVSFRHGEGIGFGLRRGEEVAEIDPGFAGTNALFARLAQGEPPLTGRTFPLASLMLLSPVPKPGKVICIGLNYVEHAKEGGNPIPDYPAVFLRCETSMTAPGQPLLRPRESERFDYEAELAIIIGRPARRVPESEALAHVAGYACANDGSVRDYQRKSTQWTMGKNFDATGSVGPELVTPDELPPGAHGLAVRSILNGQRMQDGNTADMIFSVARLVSILSEAMTLEPGDVVMTGTPSGVGYARKPPIFMRPGDVCEIEIEGIGRLRNPIACD
jgi:2-keto-4-pentenoate hydratase/2-oxohepta-3-ene-1,7-dioic acid hydratase in catechol pathway